MSINDAEELVPVTARVPVSTRQRVRVLAAQMDITRTKLAELAFNEGLDILEKRQADKDRAEAESARAQENAD